MTGKLTVLHQASRWTWTRTTDGLETDAAGHAQAGAERRARDGPGRWTHGGVHQFQAVLRRRRRQSRRHRRRPGGQRHAGGRGMPPARPTRSPTTTPPTRSPSSTARARSSTSTTSRRRRERRRRSSSEALAERGHQRSRRINVDQFPTNLVELQNYDAVILANVPRGRAGSSDEQERCSPTYVHDMGGGLVMIGGADTFGAGGWQGQKLEEVLPVNMDIPAQRQMPKGALVLVMHSCEMPDGNYWGEQCAHQGRRDALRAATRSASSATAGWAAPGGGGSQWDFPLQPRRATAASVDGRDQAHAARRHAQLRRRR